MEDNTKNCSILYCEKCSQQFFNETAYEDHLFLCNNRTKNENQIKMEIKVDKLVPIETIHEEKKAFTCSICCHTVLSKRALNSHKKSVHGEKKPHVCPICGNSFERKSNMKAHIILIL